MSGDLFEGYNFPIDKLDTSETNLTRVVLVACGSLSPITNMHLRLFGSWAHLTDKCRSYRI